MFNFQRFSRIILTTFILTTVCPTSAVTKTVQTEPLTLYRIIHASPDEVFSAVFSSSNTSTQSGAGSRLDKYFRIKNRKVRNGKVYLDIFPTLPYVDKYLPSSEVIRIVLQKKSNFRNRFIFDASVQVIDDKFVHADINLVRNEAGSLMSIVLNDTNVNDKIMQAFYFSAQRLGFGYDTPAKAVQADNQPQEEK